MELPFPPESVQTTMEMLSELDSTDLLSVSASLVFTLSMNVGVPPDEALKTLVDELREMQRQFAEQGDQQFPSGGGWGGFNPWNSNNTGGLG